MALAAPTWKAAPDSLMNLRTQASTAAPRLPGRASSSRRAASAPRLTPGLWRYELEPVGRHVLPSCELALIRALSYASPSQLVPLGRLSHAAGVCSWPSP